MLNERQKSLLKFIVKEHVKRAHPVASGAVVDKYLSDISPATVRNEMATLEKEGYIYQPHTSAGRVPSEKGWKYYLEHFLGEKTLSKNDQKLLNEAFSLSAKDNEIRFKNLAKKLAEVSKETVIVGFSPEYIYYTGLSNLFRQPEFSEYDLICSMSEIIDQLDDVISELFKDLKSDDFQILIGNESPFGEVCGAIVSKYRTKEGNEGIMTLLGPKRMPYENNLALLKYSHSLLKTI